MNDEAAVRVYHALDGLGISYSRHDHPPVFTVEEANEFWRDIEATHCKNLFVRNKKGSAHYLVIVRADKSVDLKALTARLGEDRLSFGSADRLERFLGLSAGAVSPFGLLNDTAHAVTVVLDQDVRSAARVAFHPNVNTATIALSFADFEKFLASTGNRVVVLPL